MTISERVAYLKGLAEGLELDKASKEGKVIDGILDVLADIASAVNSIEERTDTLTDYIEELDEDLGDVEEYLYDDEDFDDMDDDDDDDDFEDDFDDDDFIEIECPKCGEIIVLDADITSTDLMCPSCSTEFEITCDCDSCDLEKEDGCDCGCGHDHE